MHEFSFHIILRTTASEAFDCLCKVPTVFLLNPQWQVLQINPLEPLAENSEYSLRVKNDRLGNEQDITVKILKLKKPSTIQIALIAEDLKREITFSLTEQGQLTKILYSELRETDFTLEEKREIVYWLRSIGNYHLICQSKKPWIKAWKWFVDRCWLKMSPAGRRFVFLVIMTEILTVLILIAYVIFRMFY